MTITSRRALSTEIKVGGNRTKYAPIPLTDEAVYDLARHWYTVEEIAARFTVSTQTLLEYHGDAFRLGKSEGMTKPRMLLDNILTGFCNLSPEELVKGDVPVHNLLKAIELHAKKYEGLGSKQTIVHEGVKYDAVESAPIILERPNDE